MGTSKLLLRLRSGADCISYVPKLGRAKPNRPKVNQFSFNTFHSSTIATTIAFHYFYLLQVTNHALESLGCYGFKVLLSRVMGCLTINLNVVKWHPYLAGDDHFAFTGAVRAATLETPPIRLDTISDSIRLCLTFSYTMRSQSGAKLNVKLKSIRDGNDTLLFHLVGFHGDKWLRGQVSWTSVRDSKVRN